MGTCIWLSIQNIFQRHLYLWNVIQYKSIFPGFDARRYKPASSIKMWVCDGHLYLAFNPKYIPAPLIFMKCHSIQVNFSWVRRYLLVQCKNVGFIMSFNIPYRQLVGFKCSWWAPCIWLSNPKYIPLICCLRNVIQYKSFFLGSTLPAT